jgi:hypothetical protein
MNRTSIISLVIGAMLFGCGAGMVAHEVMESEDSIPHAYAQTGWAGQTYTYYCEHMSVGEIVDDSARFDEIGTDGWELVAVSPQKSKNGQFDQIACFKRPLD